LFTIEANVISSNNALLFAASHIMPTRRIFFTQPALAARIGILQHELRATQPLPIDAELAVAAGPPVHDHNIQTVLDCPQPRATQPLHIDAELDVDVGQPVHDQSIQTVLDYRLLRNTIVDECTRAHVNLLETLIERVAERLLEEFAEVRRVKIRISKPSAFSDCAAVGI